MIGDILIAIATGMYFLLVVETLIEIYFSFRSGINKKKIIHATIMITIIILGIIAIVKSYLITH